MHLDSIGHPLMVDPLYGERDAFYLSNLKNRKFRLNRSGVERPLLNRQSLHSHRLKFNHPFITDKIIDIEAKIPKDLKAVINQLGKLT